ncbi:protein NDR1-like [Pyrus ussuriensis x Pyrus communis]|uniref:Protein NDR1-like n=1 Tax=Pyrus ussuriensis x Pyrus communis TaxID=2448454 RepID=A0A5N5GKS6_9ROSA|nr:protein NDR1-like [Pyrus ussuriensis x Pyrus communis]
MAGQSEGCCRCCFSFIFSLGLTALFMWLSLRTSNPKCTIRSFYLPALNRTLNDTKNTTLFVTLRLKNTNNDKGVFYDAVNLTFRLQPNATAKPVATSAVLRFYQGHQKTATKDVVVGPHQGLNWTAVSSGVHRNGNVSFRVDLATAVRFKIMFWKTKRHRLNVGADVLVNDSGGKVNKKDIKLSAAPDHHLIGFFSGQVGILSNFLVLILLNFL